MKVTGIKSYAFADDEGKLYFIAKVETDEGIYGLGEVGIPRWGNAVASAIEHLSELVIGQDPFGTERLWQHMFRGGFFPADKVYCCAISAIDIALWDIKGKALGMPVYKLLGGPVRDKVVSYPAHAGQHDRRAYRQLQAGGGGRLEVRALGTGGDGRRVRVPGHGRAAGAGGVDAYRRRADGARARSGRPRHPDVHGHTHAAGYGALGRAVQERWNHTARSSSRTRCARRTRRATARWRAMCRCR